MNTPLALAYGDGIGPEIMKATLEILEAAGAALEYYPLEMGEEVYLAGHKSGISPGAWETLKTVRTLLKAPITTPQGGGYKSLNVTLRKTLGLYANVRPCRAYAPFVQTFHPKMDLVIVRENEEDLYAGIEHRQSDEVVQCLKLISRPGCERIVRYAFEYARANGRKKVTCLTKDNIMKLTDGLFRATFEEMGKEYPDLEQEHQIIDIGTARVAAKPERYDVIVTLNLYGDILSDVAAEVAGSVGLAGSANIGPSFALFEAIHGSAPDIAGQNIANPSGLLLAAVQMLVHLGQNATAERVHNAWLCTLEAGIHTADVYQEGISVQKVGTDAFARAVIENLGGLPIQLAPVSYPPLPPLKIAEPPVRPRAVKELVGVDIFLQWDDSGRDANTLARHLKALEAPLTLEMVTNRGVKVWPDGLPDTMVSDHWRCRFKGSGPLEHRDVVSLLERFLGSGLDFVKSEHLYTFDGVAGFSLGQGQ